eukprot:12109599-Ditylum_brightwellii.AAC.1
MDSYHPAVGIWASTIKYQMSVKRGISKVTMSDIAYELANNKAIPLAGCAGMTLYIITSDNNEDEPFIKALQLCINNLRVSSKKEYYTTHPDEDRNAILIKQQQELIQAQAAAAAAASSPPP